jgi:hypothetical protein
MDTFLFFVTVQVTTKRNQLRIAFTNESKQSKQVRGRAGEIKQVTRPAGQSNLHVVLAGAQSTRAEMRSGNAQASTTPG